MEPSAPPDTNGEITLYPKLPQDDSEPGGHNFRLSQITNIKNELQTELNNRIKSQRKYKTAWSGVHKLNMASNSVGTMTTGGTLASGLTGLGIPVAAGLGAAALVCSITSFATSQTGKWLSRKLEKHNKILALTQAKLSAINSLVSKALADNNISDKEFEYIQKQMDDFYAQKTMYQTKYKTAEKTEDKKKINRTRSATRSKRGKTGNKINIMCCIMHSEQQVGPPAYSF